MGICFRGQLPGLRCQQPRRRMVARIDSKHWPCTPIMSPLMATRRCSWTTVLQGASAPGGRPPKRTCHPRSEAYKAALKYPEHRCSEFRRSRYHKPLQGRREVPWCACPLLRPLHRGVPQDLLRLHLRTAICRRGRLGGYRQRAVVDLWSHGLLGNNGIALVKVRASEEPADATTKTVEKLPSRHFSNDLTISMNKGRHGSASHIA